MNDVNPKRDKVPRTRENVEESLARTQRLLEASCDAYDRGMEDEFVRIAVSIRILVHDTRNSRSLLKQLDLIDMKFISTSILPIDGNLLSHNGLSVGIHLRDKFVYGAPLAVPFGEARSQTFSDWWHEPILLSQLNQTITRAKLILTVADQDGGAHVDPSIDADYADLISGEFLQETVVNSEGSGIWGGAERATVRQIGHEVLKSFDSSYVPKLPDFSDRFSDIQLISAGHSLVRASADVNIPSRKMGRNERCHCGSGKKYKRCHGQLQS